jgi:hypothetical protein
MFTAPATTQNSPGPSIERRKDKASPCGWIVVMVRQPSGTMAHVRQLRMLENGAAWDRIDVSGPTYGHWRPVRKRRSSRRGARPGLLDRRHIAAIITRGVRSRSTHDHPPPSLGAQPHRTEQVEPDEGSARSLRRPSRTTRRQAARSALGQSRPPEGGPTLANSALHPQALQGPTQAAAKQVAALAATR